MTTILSGPRLIVRRMSGDDLADFMAYQGDPVVRRFLPGEPMDPARAAAYLTVQATLDDGVLDDWHGYAVEHRAEGRMIGDVGVWLPSRPEEIADVGFQFHPGFHGQGYAREAMELFLPYAFVTFHLREVTATADVANLPSRALMRRLGMHLIAESDREVRYGLSREVAP
ncbi:GNAT family N-acetyltransferase [Actinoplanes sp. NPDC049598]|uniref:GNAT family N-acetyltransferase n=1 Tax=Actinoplanes sp. NPDC049598 TaxID=3154626 RepID=UPI0034424031